jgi:phosphatidylserine/phosphatidylglycerophosphate/cardiolipin synthase-like enzyme
MSPTRQPKNSMGTLLVLGAVVFLGIIYSLVGSDPFGLFTTPQSVTATVEISSGTPVAAQGKQATPETTSTWWQVYFVTHQSISDADSVNYGVNGLPPEIYKGSITEKLIKHIDAAQKSIHIASFETGLVDVANALIRAKDRGVDVRWITDDENGIAADTKPGRGQFALMKKAGIPIIDDKRGALMHDKFWLFDGETVWTGSTNITVSAMFEQNNNVIVINSASLATIYERQFEDMWSGKFNAKSPSTVADQQLTIDGTKIQILFSPEDNAISHIIPYIQSAKQSIRFMAFTYTQADLGQAMLAAAKNGVDLSGVFEATGADSVYGQMTPLFCNKIPVRTDGNPAFMHHKVIIIDNRIVITGSLNFTDNADQNNNENVIIIENPDIANLYSAEFQRVWDAGKGIDSSKIKCK